MLLTLQSIKIMWVVKVIHYLAAIKFGNCGGHKRSNATKRIVQKQKMLRQCSNPKALLFSCSNDLRKMFLSRWLRSTLRDR